VSYHPAHVWSILRHELKWSWQRPARRATERNDEAIHQWVKKALASFEKRGLLAFPWVRLGMESARQRWTETTEGELGQRDQRLGGAEAERAASDQADLRIQ
jgi:hypothetical protein